jgi:hypothetical protein
VNLCPEISMYYSCCQCLLIKASVYDIWNWYTMHALYHQSMDKMRYIPCTTKYSRKVMDNEISGSFSPIVCCRGDHGDEIQKPWSTMHARDNNDYEDLNKLFLNTLLCMEYSAFYPCFLLHIWN